MEMMVQRRKKRNRSVCLFSMKYPTYISHDDGSCFCTISSRTKNLRIFLLRENAPRMRPLESCMNEQRFLRVITQIYSFFPGWLGSKPLKKHWL